MNAVRIVPYLNGGMLFAISLFNWAGELPAIYQLFGKSP